VIYAPQGAVQSTTLGNGIAETWGFNSTQPISLNAVLSGTTLMNLGWGYGADANNNGGSWGSTTTDYMSVDALGSTRLER